MKASTILVFLGTALTLVAWAPEPSQVSNVMGLSQKSLSIDGYEFDLTFGHRKLLQKDALTYWGSFASDWETSSGYVHIISHADVKYHGKLLNQAMWGPSLRGLSELDDISVQKSKSDVMLVINGSDAAGSYHAALDFRDGQARWFKVYYGELPESNSFTYFHPGADK